MWKGICNSNAKAELKRQARPLIADDVQALIKTLRPEIPAEARDAALLAVGWAAALCRSELVGLDWQKRGTGGGVLQLNDRGLVITLMATGRNTGSPGASWASSVQHSTAWHAAGMSADGTMIVSAWSWLAFDACGASGSIGRC